MDSGNDIKNDKRFLDLMCTSLVVFYAIVNRTSNCIFITYNYRLTASEFFDGINSIATFDDFIDFRDKFFYSLRIKQGEQTLLRQIDTERGAICEDDYRGKHCINIGNVKSPFIQRAFDNSINTTLYVLSLVNYDYSDSVISYIIDNTKVYMSILRIVCSAFEEDDYYHNHGFFCIGLCNVAKNFYYVEEDKPYVEDRMFVHVWLDMIFDKLDPDSKKFLSDIMARYQLRLMDEKSKRQILTELATPYKNEDTVDDHGETACRSLTLSSMGALVGIAMIIYPFISFSKDFLMPAITQKLKYIFTFTALEVFGLAIAIVGAIFFVRTIINLNSMPEGTNEQKKSAITYDPAATQTQLKETLVNDNHKDIEHG